MRPKSTRASLVCARCGTPFERPLNALRRSRTGLFYCSAECKKYNRTVAAGTIAKTCPTCGSAFDVLPYKADRLFCSSPCANRRDLPASRPCRHCGQSFTPDGDGRLYCSRNCYEQGRAIPARPCAECSTIFTPRLGTIRFCSDTCRHANRKRRVPIVCRHCSKRFETTRSAARTRVFCSARCQRREAFDSKEEREAVAALSCLLGEQAKRHQSFPWLRSSLDKPMKVDAYWPVSGLVLEYDGRHHREYVPFYHRTPELFAHAQQRDRDKAALVIAHGLRLLRIRNDEPQDEEALRAKLASA